MADFKIVISDPKAHMNSPVVKAKVVGDPEIELEDNVKEGFLLPTIKINSKTANAINAEHGIATIRVRKPESSETVKITGTIVTDDNIPENEAHVSAELLVNKTGTNEIEGELFRAKAWQVRINDERTRRLIGMKIGDIIDGETIGLGKIKLQIRGGTDNSGFPMRPDVIGGVKKRALLSSPPGYYPREKGERRRKMVRGNIITEDIVQINTKIIYEQ